VVAYTSQLPIYELTIADSDLQHLLDNPHERVSVAADLTVNGETFQTSARLHGGASRDYPKKSFRFDLDQGLELKDGRDHIILRAEWNDKSLLRNYLGLETFRNGTWLAVPSAEPVHFRINQQYYGVMWRVERIDGDFLRTRGMNNKTGSLYEADPFQECAKLGADMAPLPNMETYQCVYPLQKGEEDYADLIDLIENILTLAPWDFQPIINDTVRVNDMLVYFAAMAVIQSQDHLKKNFYLFSDPASSDDDRWTIFPWDLDLTLGHLWTYQSDTLDETIFTDSPLDFGVCPGYCNVLFSKLMEVNTYRARFFQMVKRLTDTVFTNEFVKEHIDNFLCRAEPDILADTRKRATNAEYLSRVDELRFFVDERRKFILDNSP
jgi:spore coat protein H